MRKASLILLVTALFASAAWAAPPVAEDAATAHANADTNHDGEVDRGEFRVRMLEIFYFNDGDRDGYLVVAEYERAGFEDFPEMDDDADGQGSLQEFLNIRYEDYETIDEDDSGTLSLPEVEKTYSR